MLPLLYAHGFRGKIYTTEATADLCSIMLGLRPHSAAGGGVEKQEGKTPCRNRSGGAVVYDGGCDRHHQLYRTMCPYGKELEINDNVTIRFTDVGHLLDTASIEVWLKEEGCSRKLVFSGDIGNKNQPLIKDPEYTKTADYVVMESTYGNRLHRRYAARIMSES